MTLVRFANFHGSQLASLESLAVYLDTDVTSFAGLPIEEFTVAFESLVRAFGIVEALGHR